MMEFKRGDVIRNIKTDITGLVQGVHPALGVFVVLSPLTSMWMNPDYLELYIKLEEMEKFYSDTNINLNNKEMINYDYEDWIKYFRENGAADGDLAERMAKMEMDSKKIIEKERAEYKEMNQYKVDLDTLHNVKKAISKSAQM